MNNVDKAAKIIDDWTKDGNELNSAVGSPREIVRLLADAGLLLPELPPMRKSSSATYQAWGKSVWRKTGRGICVDRLPKGMKREKAREVALELLAAVAYVEGEHG